MQQPYLAVLDGSEDAGSLLGDTMHWASKTAMHFTCHDTGSMAANERSNCMAVAQTPLMRTTL